MDPFVRVKIGTHTHLAQRTAAFVTTCDESPEVYCNPTFYHLEDLRARAATGITRGTATFPDEENQMYFIRSGNVDDGKILLEAWSEGADQDVYVGAASANLSDVIADIGDHTWKLLTFDLVDHIFCEEEEEADDLDPTTHDPNDGRDVDDWVAQISALHLPSPDTSAVPQRGPIR